MGLGLSCLAPLFAILQLYRGCQCLLMGEYPKKTNVIPQIYDNTFSHNVVSNTPRHAMIRTHNASGDRH